VGAPHEFLERELGLANVLGAIEYEEEGDVLAERVRPMYFPSVLEVHKVVSARHSLRASTFLERLDLRMSVTTGAYSEKFSSGRDESQRCPKHNTYPEVGQPCRAPWRVSQVTSLGSEVVLYAYMV
jgi:hypothetical protein